MKKIHIALLLTFVMIILTSCTGIKSTTSGLENEAYLTFVGKPNNYSGGIRVSIDDNISFQAKVMKKNTNRPKGKMYAVSTGTHVISVFYGSREVYKKQVFLSAQETREIVLP